MSYATHKNYIESFAKTFYDSVKSLIDKNAQKKYFTDQFNQSEKSVLSEVLKHARFSVECVKKFHGRVNMLNKVFII